MGVWTLSRPSMTDRWTNTPSTQADKCRSKVNFIEFKKLFNYILLSSSRYFKKPENLNMSFFFHAFHHHIQNCSYSQLISFMNELFSTIFYLLLSLPVRLQEIIFNCFFGSQIWKNDLWYVHGRNRQTGPGKATEAWTSVRRERIRRIIHQGALLHKICFRNWKVRTSV